MASKKKRPGNQLYAAFLSHNGGGMKGRCLAAEEAKQCRAAPAHPRDIGARLD